MSAQDLATEIFDKALASIAPDAALEDKLKACMSALLATVRNATLEEAAIAAETRANDFGTVFDDVHNHACREIAKAIRALKGKD